MLCHQVLIFSASTFFGDIFRRRKAVAVQLNYDFITWTLKCSQTPTLNCCFFGMPFAFQFHFTLNTICDMRYAYSFDSKQNKRFGIMLLINFFLALFLPFFLWVSWVPWEKLFLREMWYPMWNVCYDDIMVM